MKCSVSLISTENWWLPSKQTVNTLSRLFFISLHIFNGWNIRLPHYHKFGTNCKALERCYDSTFFLLQQIIMKKKETTSGRPNKTQLYIIIFIEFINGLSTECYRLSLKFSLICNWHGNNSVNGHRTIKLHGAIWLFLESFFWLSGGRFISLCCPWGFITFFAGFID